MVPEQARGREGAEDSRTRAQRLPEGAAERDLPEIESRLEPYLGLLWEAGPVGREWSTLTWAEIESWARMAGQPIYPEEAVLLRELSGVYAAALHEMRAHDAAFPGAQSEARAEQVDRSVAAVFRAMANK